MKASDHSVLQFGASGPEVADLQARLEAQGCPTGMDPAGSFRAGTRAAVEAFQYRRGLRVDGICGPQTWSGLIEAGFSLGDRFLFRRTPMLRGDDVAELQQRLSALGFDAGRVDGIFGDLTSTALGEFQRNAGLPVDGLAGADTVSALLRFGTRHQDSELVTNVRDRESMRSSPNSLAGLRVALGADAGVQLCIEALRQTILDQGVTVSTHHHPDPTIQAAEANACRADLYLGFTSVGSSPPGQAAYYTGFRYTSAGGHRFADLLVEELGRHTSLTGLESVGMAIPLLRETRMPAVICDISSIEDMAAQRNEIADSVVTAITRWIETPWD